MEDSFPQTGQGAGGMVQAVMGAMGSNGKRQMKLRSLAHHLPPAVRYWSAARGLGTPALEDAPKQKEKDGT